MNIYHEYVSSVISSRNDFVLVLSNWNFCLGFNILSIVNQLLHIVVDSITIDSNKSKDENEITIPFKFHNRTL